MGKYNNEKNDPRMIKKLATGRSLCSIIAPDIDSKYENVIFEFVEFDANYKKTKEIDIYFEADAFLGLCQQIVDKTVTRGVKADQASMQAAGKKYSDAKMFFRRGGGTVDGVVKYREFYIQASSSDMNSALLVAEQCDGYKDKKGLINPNGKNKIFIRVPVNFQALIDMACLAQARMNAFFVAKQLSGAYTRTRRNTEEEVSVNNDNSSNYTGGQSAVITQQQTQMPVENIQYQPEPEYIPAQPAYSGVQEIDPDEAFYQMYATQYN